MRARDLGIVIGRGRPGPANAITDVRRRPRRSRDDRPRRRAARRRRGAGPDRRHDGRPARRRHLDRAGLRRQPPPERQRRADRARVDPRGGPPDRPDRDHEHALRSASSATGSSATPSGGCRSGRRTGRCRSSGETWDGLLNDIDGFHVTADHVDEALAAAADGAGRRGQRRRRDRDGLPRVQGRDRDGVAGRRRGGGGFTVGVLVQANYGRREWLRVDGVPVGEAIPVDGGAQPVSAPSDDDEADAERRRRAGSGSIIVDHRDRRAAAAPPVRAARPAGRARDRPDGRHRGPLERRPVPVLRDGQPDAAADVVPGRPAASSSTSGR